MVDGDEALAARAGEMLGLRSRVFAVATVCGGDARVGRVGAPAGADFELGSISKGITGLLYADALTRGEVEEDRDAGRSTATRRYSPDAGKPRLHRHVLNP